MGIKADEGLSWIVLFSGAIAYFMAYGFSYSLGLFYEEFLEIFGETKSKTSWIVSLNYGLMCATGNIFNKFYLCLTKAF